MKSVRNALEVIEQNALCKRKGSKKLREKVVKAISKSQQENEVIKIADKVETNVEEKVVGDEKENREDNAKLEYMQEQEQEIEYIDLTSRRDNSKVSWFPVYFKVVLLFCS